jgi:Na+-translocating ferredoxin:NAD+ oxidoreductase RnfE subunit
MLQPYANSGQINGLVSGIADAARFEFMNNSRPGIARSYWDAFGVGVILAVALIVLGSLWSLVGVIRARRAEAGEG